MKVKHLMILALGLGIFSCAKDNFEPPKAVFQGRLVYQGEPLLVQSPNVQVQNRVDPILDGLTDFPVFFELWQKAYQNRSSIRVPIKQDGSFSALLFNGDYKLTIPNGQGPFLWKTTATNAPDSLTVNLNGSQTLDIEVTPYYMIRNAQFATSGRVVSGTVAVNKIITDANAKDVERVSLYVNRTQFVDAGNNIKAADLAGSAIPDLNNVSIATDAIGAIVPSQNYVFARIGVKIAGVEDMIYSPVQRVELQ